MFKKRSRILCTLSYSLGVHICFGPVVSENSVCLESVILCLCWQSFCLLFHVNPWALKRGVQRKISQLELSAAKSLTCMLSRRADLSKMKSRHWEKTWVQSPTPKQEAVCHGVWWTLTHLCLRTLVRCHTQVICILMKPRNLNEKQREGTSTGPCPRTQPCLKLCRMVVSNTRSSEKHDLET